MPCFVIQTSVSQYGPDLRRDMKAWSLGSEGRCKHVLAVKLFPHTLRLQMFSLDFSMENMLDVVGAGFDSPGTLRRSRKLIWLGLRGALQN
jgi:hypothetical protein